MTVLIEVGILLGIVGIAFLLYGEYYRTTNTLVLGSGKAAADLLRDIEAQSTSQRHKVLGFIKTSENYMQIPTESVLQVDFNLLKLATELDVKAIVVAIDRDDVNAWAQQLLDCKLNGITLLEASALEHHRKTVVSPMHNKGNLIDLSLSR